MLFDDWLILIVSDLADLFFYLLSLMLGSVVLIGHGFGKIRTSGRFASLWKIFIYALLEGILFVKLQGPVTNIIEMLLRDAVIYISGITTSMLGTFFLWLVHTLDFKITKEYRWVFPMVCYGITGFDLWLRNFAGPEFSSSSIQAISIFLVLVFLIVVVYIVWKAFGPKNETDDL